MKKAFTILAAVLLTASGFAQSPEKMSYQAVIRNSSNALVTSSAVGMRISILQGSASGTAVYSETQTPNTNANGLVTIEIGTGITSNDFSAIGWANGPYFIKTETDPTGGTNYTITGTSQLLSVPYALYAEKAGNGFSGNYTDLKNKPALVDSAIIVTINGNQTISGNKSFTGKVTVTSPINTTDAANKAYVTLSVSSTDDTLYLGSKQWVIIPGISAANLSTVTDIDGNVYKTVKIGNQVWMAENLKTTKYANDTAITNGTAIANIGYTDKYYFIYQNDPNYKNTYGLLYSWAAATNGVSSSTNPSGVQGVCPTGWHVPSNAEKTQLITYLGGSDIAGGKLKEIDTTHWQSPNTGATNESGFTGLGTGGFYYQSAFRYIYMQILQAAWIWTATEGTNITTAYALDFGYNIDDAPLDNSDNKGNGESVRCVKD